MLRCALPAKDSLIRTIELSRRRPEALWVLVFGRATAMPLIAANDSRGKMRFSAAPVANSKKSIQYP
jgi:hypothetical protein